MKKLISALLSLALCLGLCAPALAAGSFTDVEGSWAAGSIDRATSLGLVSGVGGGRYAPNSPVSYREFAVMLCGIRYQDETAEAVQANTGAWWLPGCTVAGRHGLWDSTAMADPQVWSRQGGQPVPRQAMAQILYNYLQAEEKQLPGEIDKARAMQEIADLELVAGRHKNAVLTCYAMGLLHGTGSGFSPGASMDRAQAAVVLCALYDAVMDGADRTAGDGAQLANGAALTEANVQAVLNGLRDSYPEGMPWTNEDNSYTSQAMYIKGYGCAAFAFLFSDTVFGDLPVTAQHASFDRIRPGDILRTQNDTHMVVVLEKRADSVIVVEGNYNKSVHWDREISRQALEAENFYVRTRYPV